MQAGSALLDLVRAREQAPLSDSCLKVVQQCVHLLGDYIYAIGQEDDLPAQRDVPIGEDWAAGAFYFDHSLRRTRGLSGKGTGGTWQCRSTQQGKCTKNVLTSPGFSPGVFVVCCEHGVVLGFELMQHHESPRTPYEVFMNRLGEPAGKVVVYDNGCNLLHYGLLRQCKFWSKLQVAIDTFHAKGHVACTECMDSCYCGAQNSAACEQVNSFLQAHSGSLHAMTSRSAMEKLWLLCHVHNTRKHRGQQQEDE